MLATAVPGCRTPGGAPDGSAFRPRVRTAPAPPNVADQAAIELARAALVSDQERTARALRRLHSIETVLAAAEEPPTGLLPVSTDLRNTLLDDRRSYREASRSLLRRDDLDPELRARLEIFRNDDPLELAEDRIQDAWLIEFGRAFNALAEPIGRSIMTHHLAPYRLGRSLVNYAVEVYTQEALSLQRRQALAHWKEFLARNPDAPEAERIGPQVQAAQARWSRTQRDRALQVSRRALELGKVRLALVYADRALRHMPEDRQAAELREEAAARLLGMRDQQRRSLEVSEDDGFVSHPGESRALALAMLEPGGDLAGAARRLRAVDPDGPLADEARFVEAIALGEAGDPDAMWEELRRIADADASNMARHAAALIANPELNTYGAYRRARSRNRWDRAKWVFLGPFFQGMPDRGLPGPLDWVVDAPSLAEALLGTPMRLIHVPWAKALPAERVAAAFARRDLMRHPNGPHAEEVRDWLQGYELRRGNSIAALGVAEQRRDVDLEQLAELRERAAEQYLEAALRERSLGMRIGMLGNMGRIYPGSRASRVAARIARSEVEGATAQRIQISRGFLEENPEVAGPEGLGLRPELLDDDAANGELHPEGVMLLGARVVEVSYLGPSGHEKHPPTRIRETLQADHLARVVSQLEETTYRNMLVDADDFVSPDASRDLYFERVRLGLADEVDPRPGATSRYIYRGLSERYGMVRAREPILPFDIVIQGSLKTLSLGAFPRIRRPRETPDAILYR
jgi:tetratricopeptide (TPR) repeat protein